MKTYHVVVSARGRDAAAAARAIQRRLTGTPAHRQAGVVKVQDEDGNVLWRPSTGPIGRRKP
jgi:ribosomal protein S11